ncbi:acyl carrier protein [Ancylobacter sp. Lp-2]|uniref:acyl carrier protein n=1 Tax=Ancylobacter sp. Lp-2 TaxID=2881339 RepID=UPI001E5C0004|nr:acyl carrier protein [Ancylobacter sp. Lp-2]MCB4768482.1 acyl carrier protein [Ancylobacter sp. Lp-2]
MDRRLPCDRETLRSWMVNYIGGVLTLPDGVPTDQTFDTYGFDSVEAVVMAGVMEEEFGTQVDPVQLFEQPSIDAFSAAFSSDGGSVAAATETRA